MRITGTFLDEISHDIPSQNWGIKEWNKDFKSMKSAGIDTVILIRCGYKRWMTFPSNVLKNEQNCYVPPLDLVKIFLELSEKYNMNFWFGTYDSGYYWHNEEFRKEIDINKKVTEEVWKRYGSFKAFKGWYLSLEVSRKSLGIIELYYELGKHVKDLSSGLPVLISPYVDGIKNVSAFDSALTKKDVVGLKTHEKEWDEIMANIKGAVDVVAFQDGHVDFYELLDFLIVNKSLAERYGLRCWSNTETFDRDMPIKFLPIKWEKLKFKLEAAERAKVEKIITFEWSHFLSPNSCYPQAKNLYNRYKEYLKQK